MCKIKIKIHVLSLYRLVRVLLTMTRIGQLNLNRSWSTSIAINDHQSEVMLLTEPYVNKQGKSPIDKNKWYAFSVGNHPRALVIAKKNVKCMASFFSLIGRLLRYSC
jgi:hypothetical protein